MKVEPSSGLDIQMQYSFWLVPAEGIRSTLRCMIHRLADQFDGVYFEPHVTIYSGTSNDAEVLVLANSVASTFKPLEFTVLKLDHTDNYTKTLFVRLQDSGAGRRMFEATRRGSANPSEYVLDPHLNLLYKRLPVTTQTEICQTLDVPQGNYLFDRLCVIETEIPLTRPEQITRWRTVYESPLGLR